MTQHGVLDPTARRIALDSPVNFRDLGGYAAPDGRTVRWRTVFRADGLDSMTERDLDVVIGDLNIKTVIDLRTPRELDVVGVGAVQDRAIGWHNISIIDETQQLWRDALDGGTIVDQYFAMLDGSSAKFVEALSIIADTDDAVVFHCAAGKDRTGLLAALLLSLLGVSDDEIGHDYALTAEVLPLLKQRWEARAQDPRFRDHYARPGLKEAAAKAMTADSGTMSRVLLELRERHGSPERWLVDAGLAPATIDHLRRQLLA